MTKEKVVELLKEKLTIQVSVREHRDWDDEKVRTKVEVSLYFDNELISKASDYA